MPLRQEPVNDDEQSNTTTETLVRGEGRELANDIPAPPVAQLSMDCRFWSYHEESQVVAVEDRRRSGIHKPKTASSTPLKDRVAFDPAVQTFSEPMLCLGFR